MHSVGRALARAAKRHCSVPPWSSCACCSGRLHRRLPPASCPANAQCVMAIAQLWGRLHGMHACRCDGGRRGRPETMPPTHKDRVESAGGPASPELRCEGDQVRGGMPSIDPRGRGEARRRGAGYAGAEGDASPDRRPPPGPRPLHAPCATADDGSRHKINNATCSLLLGHLDTGPCRGGR